ncbi:hypothetical protein A9Z05_09215 [Burkholderia sp. A2]|nr:hypothetical protein A9Z05_09215 [Burkholderia sp. A2]
MDVMGEALRIDRAALLGLAKEAELSAAAAGDMIDAMCGVASQFSAIAKRRYVWTERRRDADGAKPASRQPESRCLQPRDRTSARSCP